MQPLATRAADRLAIYIDNSNLKISANIDTDNSIIDYKVLVEQLTAGRDLWNVKLYDTYAHFDDGRINYAFPNCISVLGIEGHFRDTYDPEKNVQKQIDTSIVADMTEDAIHDRFDTAIIVSGDGDMVPGVEKVISYGKKVEIASFYGPVSQKLRVLGRFIDLGDMCFVISRESSHSFNGGEAE